jgi:ribose 5-phosphate isomerase B
VRFNPADDYPNFILPCAKKVAATPESRGVVLGGSGQGEAMAANRIKGVRAAVYYGGPMDIIKLSRLHNDANVLSLGARFVSVEEAQSALELWLKTPFSEEERHARRIQELDM